MRIFAFLFLFVSVIGCFFCGIAFFILSNKVVDFSVLERYDPGVPTVLLDDEGNEWARFQLDKRDTISLDNMPKHLIDAFIAKEDWNFFNHWGISFKGIARSIFKNIYYRKRVQGASTITQQLVRLLFFYSKKTFRRKIKEQIYAILVELQISKEQILETYLNHVCFGRGIYGVQAACQRFWGKSVADITLDEAAVLAGIVQYPERYCPLASIELAEKRRNVVLFQMKKLALITDEQYQQYKALPITLKMFDRKNIAPHLKERIRLFLMKLVGKKELYTGGLSIKTTLNQNIQKLALKSFDKQYETLTKKFSDNVDGALISIDTATGEIKALIGGSDFGTSKYDRAFLARRQMGSIFKPILYSAAIQSGKRFSDLQVDEPIEITQNNSVWSPKNADLKFNGEITLAWALSISNNIVAVKTLLDVGIESVIDLAKKFRLRCEFNPYPSLALGCVDVSLKEAVGMFNVFANGGMYVEPHYIKWVKDKWGTKIYKSNPEIEQIINSSVCGKVSKVLELWLKRVKKLIPQKWVNAQAISKTGTANDARVCWFVGSTPTLTTGVYIGRDDNKSMGRNVYPLRTAFPIWIGLNIELDFETKKFSFDPSLTEVCINRKTGKVTTENDKEAIAVFV